MEFDEHEHEHEQDEVGIQLPPGNFDNPGRKNVGYRYRECMKNHALGIGGHALDGCGEFMAGGEDGTLDALKCAACGCHRNFHRKEINGQQQQQQRQQPHAAHQHHYVSPPPYYHHPHHHERQSGYLHINPAPYSHHHPPPLALPSTSREDLDEISNPSSSGGGGGGGGGGVSGSKKRFRTKFTQEQKDKMLAFSEALGWRIQKHDEAAVQQFCAETGVKRHVLKVWMHNNKHTIGKKP